MAVNGLSSNWKKLQAKIQAESTSSTKSLKRKRQEDGGAVQPPAKQDKKPRPNDTAKTNDQRKKMTATTKNGYHSTLRRTKSATTLATTSQSPPPSRPGTSHGSRIESQQHSAQPNEGISPTALPGRYIALDCEMVGVGPNPDKTSQLARVSIVNYHGQQIYDSFVLPTETVTDYRTSVSGVRARDLKPGVARSFTEVTGDVATLLSGRVLVGHALRNDIAVLMLSHPRRDLRDTAKYAKFRALAAGKAPSLKKLAKEVLGLDTFQSGEHSSVEDARVCMLLYRQEKDGFEAENDKLFGRVVKAGGKSGSSSKSKAKKKKKG